MRGRDRAYREFERENEKEGEFSFLMNQCACER